MPLPPSPQQRQHPRLVPSSSRRGCIFENLGVIATVIILSIIGAFWLCKAKEADKAQIARYKAYLEAQAQIENNDRIEWLFEFDKLGGEQ
jgi:hypothetical protein